MIKLIVSADDLGLSKGVNQAIINAHTQGIVTNASILANGNYFQEAVCLTKKQKSLGIGLHLNFIRGKPVANNTSISRLVNNKGNFFNALNLFLLRYFCGLIREEDVYNEAVAQVRKVLDAGIIISHLDTEKYLNRLPLIFNVVIKVAQKFGIKRIRYANKFLSWPQKAEFRISDCTEKILKYASINEKLIESSKLLHPGLILSFNFKKRADKKELNKFINFIKDEIIELIVHPSLTTNDYPKEWGYFKRKMFAIEDYTFLIDPEIKKIIKDNSISLISYHHLN